MIIAIGVPGIHTIRRSFVKIISRRACCHHGLGIFIIKDPAIITGDKGIELDLILLAGALVLVRSMVGRLSKCISMDIRAKLAKVRLIPGMNPQNNTPGS